MIHLVTNDVWNSRLFDVTAFILAIIYKIAIIMLQT